MTKTIKNFNNISELNLFDEFLAKPKAIKSYKKSNGETLEHKPYKKYLRTEIKDIFSKKGVIDKYLSERELIARVFPFKVNSHLLDLIDWQNFQTDPIFQLTFPQNGMLKTEELERLKAKIVTNASHEEIAKVISEIREEKNPAPSNQSANRPSYLDETDDEIYECEGLQHKYHTTVLMFHKNAQTCHSYCSYCFRFNQFVGKDQFLEEDSDRFHKYLKQHTEISDILITGGDPATMKTNVFKSMLLPLLKDDYSHIKNIRMGTKALTYHPYRFLTEPDADDLIELFSKLIENGKHISIMAHFTHYNEISDATKEAIKRLRSIGCNIRTQAPLMKHINDSSEIWAKMWEMQVTLGMIPYYMFIARDTGPHKYFEVTFDRALKIYQNARKSLSGLSHTARGPSMSAGPGKICIIGQEKIAGEEVFILKFLQGRNPNWCDRVFFAKYDPNASWLSHLRPAFGEKEFFFEEEYKNLLFEKKKQ